MTTSLLLAAAAAGLNPPRAPPRPRRMRLGVPTMIEAYGARPAAPPAAGGANPHLPRSVLTACSHCITRPPPKRAQTSCRSSTASSCPTSTRSTRSIDSLSPWLQIDADSGDVQFSASAINGFIGGTVGVVGTVLATQKKKAEVKDRLTCVYCGGSGTIKCGTCAGTGSLLAEGVTSFTEGAATQACGTCEGTSHVVCINCQGSGLNIPDDFLQKLGDAEAGFTDDDYIGLFDEVKFPSRDEAAARQAEGAAKAAEEAERLAADPSAGVAQKRWRRRARPARSERPSISGYLDSSG